LKGAENARVEDTAFRRQKKKKGQHELFASMGGKKKKREGILALMKERSGISNPERGKSSTRS